MVKIICIEISRYYYVVVTFSVTWNDRKWFETFKGTGYEEVTSGSQLCQCLNRVWCDKCCVCTLGLCTELELLPVPSWLHREWQEESDGEQY